MENDDDDAAICSGVVVTTPTYVRRCCNQRSNLPTLDSRRTNAPCMKKGHPRKDNYNSRSSSMCVTGVVVICILFGGQNLYNDVDLCTKQINSKVIDAFGSLRHRRCLIMYITKLSGGTGDRLLRDCRRRGQTTKYVEKIPNLGVILHTRPETTIHQSPYVWKKNTDNIHLRGAPPVSDGDRPPPRLLLF